VTVADRTTAETAIVETVLDYFEGWFDGDAARMERALHPSLAKRALATDGRTLDETTADWMIEATGRGVAATATRATAGSRSRSRTSTARSRMRPFAPASTGSTFSSCERPRAGRS